MTRQIGCVVLAFVTCSMTQLAGAQKIPEKPQNPASLELSTEIAATTGDGYPSALRITLKNVGNLAVDLPMLHSDGKPDGGVGLHFLWRASDDSEATGSGTDVAAIAIRHY